MQVGTREALVQEMAEDLHDLCQPLTALQCRLEMASMQGDPKLSLDIVKESLIETSRMFAVIAHMRERLLSEEAEKQAGGIAHASDSH